METPQPLQAPTPAPADQFAGIEKRLDSARLDRQILQGQIDFLIRENNISAMHHLMTDLMVIGLGVWVWKNLVVPKLVE